MNRQFELKEIIRLYEKFGSDLMKVRQEQIALYQARGYLPTRQASLPQRLLAFGRRAESYMKGYPLLKPQLDDVEAEITYLLLREYKPESIVEISPCGGWSSTWILRAIRDNQKGHLYSFDLIDASVKNIPKELSEGRRTFIQGPVQENLSRLPKQIDYLFIDSDHSAEFAQWYIENIFPRLSKGTPVSVHDVFHTSEASGFDREGGVIIQWLEKNKIPCFTASPARSPDVFQSLIQVKEKLGLMSPIHRSAYNSMIYFTMQR